MNNLGIYAISKCKTSVCNQNHKNFTHVKAYLMFFIKLYITVGLERKHITEYTVKYPNGPLWA